MPNPIAENASSTLEKLVKLEENSEDTISADGDFLVNLTGLSPKKINEAVDLMESAGWIDRLNYSGTSPFDFGEISLTSMGKHAYYEAQASQPPQREVTQPPVFTLDIFISHSSKDVMIAKALIELLRSSLNIHNTKIRCTSVNGYKLRSGADTNKQLQKEIYSSKVFIGLISKHSIESTYVLFELGARWGAKLSLFPLLTNELGVQLLKGPLQNINAMNACIETDLFQFIEDIGAELNLTPANASVYKDKLDDLMRICLQSTVSTETGHVAGSKSKAAEIAFDAGNRQKTDPDFYQNAEAIIKEQSIVEWPEDPKMQVYHIERQRKAVKNLLAHAPADIDPTVFNKIRLKARQEWPLDFTMQLHDEEKQVEALRKLKTI